MCFLVPAAEAVITTIASKAVRSHEKKNNGSKTKISHHLDRLNAMLWGGVILLAVDHIWNGEIVPFFPFLTALKSPDSTAAMINEITSLGTVMAALITSVWIISTIVSIQLEHRSEKIAVVEEYD